MQLEYATDVEWIHPARDKLQWSIVMKKINFNGSHPVVFKPIKVYIPSKHNN